ncbi:ribonuclease H [Senna tora]|uniref:Ribonuclease H n=1 Tax=Senna tora TaxID=362788 RepID=A0A834TU15_9FABA|nr:ribonuclease H [Senna tora]
MRIGLSRGPWVFGSYGNGGIRLVLIVASLDLLPRGREGAFVDMINKASDPITSHPTPNTKLVISVAWEKPLNGWVKINSDSSVKNDSHSGGFGALVHDENGCWVQGVYGHIFNPSILKAEAWGTREGLILAKNLGFEQVILETDSKGFLIKHCWREANRSADYLANLGAGGHEAKVLMSHPTVELSLIIQSDVMGIQLPRTVRV